MTSPEFLADRARVTDLHAHGTRAEVDALLAQLHIKYHQRPIDHVRVHVTWMGVQLARKAYLRALFHAFAGFVVAGPASLVQRYTGLVAPAFAEQPRQGIATTAFTHARAAAESQSRVFGK